MSRSLLRVRNLAFAGLLVILFYRLYRPGDGRRLSESVRLASYMNDAPVVITASKSSFDWSTVKFQYPPNELPVLPKRRDNAPSLPRIQHAFEPENEDAAVIRNNRREEVKRVFQKSWLSYKEHAWMKDALKPLSSTGVDQFCGWAATLVDSLDTLWIMGLRDDFYEAVNAVASIDFGQSTSRRVNTFETNIRYLGGMLAAYDLSGHDALKTKAVELGNLLYAAFNTPNNMPVDFIDFDTAKAGTGLTVEEKVVSASPGTLSLEFTRLSQITGNSKYYAAISKIMDVFYENQNKTKLPGIWPMYVSMNHQDVTSSHQFTIGGNADSLFEYVPKEYALLGGAEPKYEIMSRTFMDAAKQHLLFRPMLPDNADILIPGNVDVGEDGPHPVDPESEHLACFIGGLYALGGRLFNSDDYLETGAKLARGCIYAYKAFPTGIMPERYNMVACKSVTNCAWVEQTWDEEKNKRSQYMEHLPRGFTTAKDPRYILRPEAIESVFVLHRITGLREFQEAAWDMFRAVRDATSTPLAAAAVMDVTVSKTDVQQNDYMEVSVSFCRTPCKKCPLKSVANTYFLELLDGGDTEVLLFGFLAA